MIGNGYELDLKINMSNQYFKQIDLAFPKISTDDIKGELVVEHLDPMTNTGIRYWKLKDHLLEQQLIDLFASKELYNPVITYAEVDRDIWLHTDINGTVVINYYIETPKSTTAFYITKDNYHGFKIGKDTIYDPIQCIKQDEFIAESNTTYVLDVSSIHGVKLHEKGIRKFLSIGFLDWTYHKLIDQKKLS